MSWAWLASWWETPAATAASSEDVDLITSRVRANWSTLQLKDREPLEVQLSRALAHCDFARRQAHRSQLELQKVTRERDCLKKALQAAEFKGTALQEEVRQLKAQLETTCTSHRPEAAVQKAANLLVIDGCSTTTEHLVHAAMSLMHSRLEGSSGLGTISVSHQRDAWSTVGEFERGNCKLLSCVNVVAGCVFRDVGSSSLYVDGLGSIRRSGGGACCAAALLNRAIAASKNMIFLTPKDADAEGFWMSQGFRSCDPRSMGLDASSLRAILDHAGLLVDDLMVRDLRRAPSS
ncbi:unnamed protein product [Symbiodinium sp. CCMP2592]|nr:unnamed protein product [Symbiodinium sp. CCMP2592]